MFLPTNKTQAAKLLSAAEMDVFAASLAPAIKELSAARLAGKVKRARTMRDKFRDLLKRQKVATRGRTGTKAGTSGSANERTAKKAEIFDEVLQRFSARLEQVQAAAARAAAREAIAKAKSQARAEKAAAAAAKKVSKTPARKAARSAASTQAKPVRKATAKPPAGGSVKAAVKAAVKRWRRVAARKSAAPTRSAKAPAVAPGTAGDSVGPGSKRAKAAAKTAGLVAARKRPIQAHVASVGRRQQAKRDNRR
jgi:hypothetical protein